MTLVGSRLWSILSLLLTSLVLQGRTFLTRLLIVFAEDVKISLILPG